MTTIYTKIRFFSKIFSNNILKIYFLKKPAFSLWLLSCLFLVSPFSKISAQDFPPDEFNTKRTNTEKQNKVITESYSNVAQKGNLRLNTGLAYSTFQWQKKKQYAWRGVFDYYISDSFSFSGTANLALNSIDELKTDFLALGFNIHFLDLGDLGLFLSGAAGFALVRSYTLPLKAISTMDMGAGAIWFGSIFYLIGEASYRLSEYYARDTYLDLKRMVVSFGIGIKL